EHEIWKTRSPRSALMSQQQHQQLHQLQAVDEEHPTATSSTPTPASATLLPESAANLVEIPEQAELEEEDNEVERQQDAVQAKPWFFKNGEYYPKPAKTYSNRKARKRHAPRLLPHQDPHSDRILNQLMYVPHNYDQIKSSGKLKTILLYNGLGPWNVKKGREVFLKAKCPVDTCELTANRDLASSADMILYKDHYIPTGIRRPSNSKQVSMLYYLECPYHT
ncbi:hypothetical protein KR026_008162, partial [Drosophila bipectinata]